MCIKVRPEASGLRAPPADRGSRPRLPKNRRISAIGLFLLIPIKIYTGWAAKGKVPELPAFLGSGKKVHLSAGIDILLLLFFLLHGFYGLRVILIDIGVIREDKFFWRTLALALGIFALTVWFVYIHEY